MWTLCNLSCFVYVSLYTAMCVSFFLMTTPHPLHYEYEIRKKSIVCATPLGAGFVDIFIGQIHSESDDQIQ